MAFLRGYRGPVYQQELGEVFMQRIRYADKLISEADEGLGTVLFGSG